MIYDISYISKFLIYVRNQALKSLIRALILFNYSDLCLIMMHETKDI